MRPAWIVLLAACLAAPLTASAQLTTSEREALARLRVERGGRPEDVDALMRVADDAAMRGLPVSPLANKIREGLAKGHPPARIEPVVQQMVSHLEVADRLIRDVDPAATAAAREPAVVLTAEALGAGVTVDEIRDLRAQAQAVARPSLSAEGLASAARALSFIKDAKLPVPDGTAVMTESARQGYRPHEMLDVGREVKRRERDFQTGRATLRAVRDAIARGDRPEQLFRGTRVEPVERPAATRPEPATTERPERPARPEPVQRPQRPEVPERPARPQ